MGAGRMLLQVAAIAVVVCLAAVVNAQLASNWLPFDLGMEPSLCDGNMGECEYEEEEERRVLRQIHFYIGYAALAANRIPCPPRSGRSYYTNNCYRARGPVMPYHRGCSAITRCRRDTS